MKSKLQRLSMFQIDFKAAIIFTDIFSPCLVTYCVHKEAERLAIWFYSYLVVTTAEMHLDSFKVF